MHPFVLRQLRRHGSLEVPEALQPILASVCALLHDVGRERELGAAAMIGLTRELESRDERMQQSEQRYRLLFDESPMSMFAVTRNDCRVIAWNRAAETTFGYAVHDVLDQTIERLRLFGDDECLLTPIRAQNVPPPDSGASMEVMMHTRDEQVLEGEIRFHRIVLLEHDAVILQLRDVTIERASVRALAESEARFRAFFEYAGIAIHVLSFDGIILAANPASQQLLGYSPSEVVGRSAVSLSPEEDIEAGRELGRELRTSQRDSVTVKRRFFHKDGHVVLGQLTVSRVMHGGEARMIGMIQDITERKRMEGQLLKQAFQDDLTGLANRVLFRDRLRHALERRSRGDSRVAVILLDLDGVKRVNDALGHTVGDQLLQIVGRRIASAVRTGQTVARLGGDEFAMVIESIEQGDDPEVLAECLLLLRGPHAHRRTRRGFRRQHRHRDRRTHGRRRDRAAQRRHRDVCREVVGQGLRASLCPHHAPRRDGVARSRVRPAHGLGPARVLPLTTPHARLRCARAVRPDRRGNRDDRAHWTLGAEGSVHSSDAVDALLGRTAISQCERGRQAARRRHAH